MITIFDEEIQILHDLAAAINKDDEGDYFICKEAKDLVDAFFDLIPTLSLTPDEDYDE
jgi:hypothetical protein